MPMSFYWMNLPIEGTLYPEGSVLSGHSLAQYERQIQYMLHNVVSTKEMQDNGRLLLSLPEGKLKERILAADLSVMAEKGELLGRLELETALPLLPGELSDLQAYLQQQFSKGWGNWFQQKPIFNEQKTLLIRFPLPKVYQISDQKYEITAISHPKFPWLHRIRALVQVNEDVSRGALGGYVESLQNLSQEGHCWIYDDAIACEDSQVIQDGRLFDGAIARDSALVSGDARLFERASAEGHSCILSGELNGAARAAGNAVIKQAENGHSPLITGHSNIYGTVCGWFVVKDNIFSEETLLNPTEDMFVMENGTRSVMVKQRKLEPPDRRGEKEMLSGDEKIKKRQEVR